MEKRKAGKTAHAKLEAYGLDYLTEKGKEAPVCFRFSAGECIFREGETITWFGIVLSGSAKVCQAANNGKNLVLCYYASDGTLGDIEFMTDEKLADCTVIAMTEFECIAIPRTEWPALRSNVTFLNHVGRELAGKLVRSSDNLVSAALYTGEERLCAYILQASHHRIFNDVLTDVSCSVGMSYRHMFRLLGELCEEGILEKKSSGYRILDMDRLTERSAGSHAQGIAKENKEW
jgi:CRP-like cAMP-binding protein